MTLREMDMLTETSNPVDMLMAGYAAGNLPAPLSALVSAHLDMSPVNRKFVADMEALLASEMDDIDPGALIDRDALLDRVLSDDSLFADTPNVAMVARSGLPPQISSLLGMELDDIPWKSVFPGVREFKADDMEGCRVSMFRLRAGTAVPAHTHGGAEVTLVLEGGYTDGVGHYVAGDLAYADDSINHRPVADDDGDCIGLAITDAPLKLTGALGRIVNPLLRL